MILPHANLPFKHPILFLNKECEKNVFCSHTVLKDRNMTIHVVIKVHYVTACGPIQPSQGPPTCFS